MPHQFLTAVVTDKRTIEMRYLDAPKPSGTDFAVFAAATIITMRRGTSAHESEDVRKALAVISARRDQLSNLLTHEVSLEEADFALRLIGQEIPGEEAIHVAINPWRA